MRLDYEETSIAEGVSFPHGQSMLERLAIAPDWLKAELEKPGRSQSALARELGFSSAAIVNRMCSGERKITAEEADKIRAYLAKTARGEAAPDMFKSPDLPVADALQDYVEVEVLPTHAGMGGGGTGDADRQTTLLPRRLVEQELGARPADILIVDVLGDSMVPLFFEGDRVAINRSRTSLSAPGVFALWDGDGFVLKNVDRDTHAGTIRVFSENPKYKERVYRMDEIETLQIMGRPVWFARRL